MSTQRERLDRARRALRGLLVVNLVLLMVNVGIATRWVGEVGSAASVGGTVSPVSDALQATGDRPARSEPPPPPPPGAGDAPDDPLQAFLDATAEPLERAAREHEADLDKVLPTQAEVDALLAEGSFDSDAGRVVLAKLEEGYRAYNMPFPSLPDQPARPRRPRSEAPPPVGASGLPPAPDIGEAGSTAQDVLGAYFTVQRDRIERAARAQGADPSALLPAESDCAAAAATGRLDSDESVALLDQLRAAYAALGLSFVEPGPLVVEG